MGYTTEFYGEIEIDPPLSPDLVAYINRFGRTRRMERSEEELLRLYPDIAQYGFNGPNGPTYGRQGEYFCSPDRGDRGAVVNYNCPPASQPGLWCQWRIINDGRTIEWDGGEKFYEADRWMEYIITNFIAPWGHVCNGSIEAQGEDRDDRWLLNVDDNIVSVESIDPWALKTTVEELKKGLSEIKGIINQLDYFEFTEKELLNNPDYSQLEIISEVRSRLKDVWERNKSIMEE